MRIATHFPAPPTPGPNTLPLCGCPHQITLNPRFHLVTNGTYTPDSGTIQLDVPNMIYQNLEVREALPPPQSLNK